MIWLSENWAQPWLWIAMGVLLGALEMVIPGFVLLGFAIGAAIVGALIWLGLLGGSAPLALLFWAVLAAICWYLLRRFVGVRHGQVRVWDRDINEN